MLEFLKPGLNISITTLQVPECRIHTTEGGLNTGSPFLATQTRDKSLLWYGIKYIFFKVFSMILEFVSLWRDIKKNTEK